MLLDHFAHHGIHDFLLPLLADPSGQGSGGGGGGSVIPDAPASLPPGLSQATGKLFSWGKGVDYAVGALALLVCAGMIIGGRRNRSQVATEGAVGVGWVILGLTLVGAAAMLVRSFTS
jgi:hypothetical protein